MGRLPVLSRDETHFHWQELGLIKGKIVNRLNVHGRMSLSSGRTRDFGLMLHEFVKFSEIFIRPLFVEILEMLFVSSRQTSLTSHLSNSSHV